MGRPKWRCRSLLVVCSLASRTHQRTLAAESWADELPEIIARPEVVHGQEAVGFQDSPVDFDAVVNTVAFGSCSKPEDPQVLWEAIAARRPDLWLWLGDNVYADRRASAGKWRWVGEEDTRELYEQQMRIPGYVRLLRGVRAVMGTWDDHDYGENNAGVEFAAKRTTQALALDFLGVPAADTARRERRGLYSAATFGPPGKRLRVILLDTRWHREQIGGDGDVLGAEQTAWLRQQLAQPADVVLVGSSIQVLSNHLPFVSRIMLPEGWALFPSARARLFQTVRESNASGVVFLSGDVHFGEVAEAGGGCALDYPVMDVTSSGMTHTVMGFLGKLPLPAINPLTLFKRHLPAYMDWVWPSKYRQPRYVRRNFGEVAVDWERRTVCGRVFGEDRATAVVERCRSLSALAPPSAPVACAGHRRGFGYTGAAPLPLRDTGWTPGFVAFVVMASYAPALAAAAVATAATARALTRQRRARTKAKSR